MLFQRKKTLELVLEETNIAGLRAVSPLELTYLLGRAHRMPNQIACIILLADAEPTAFQSLASRDPSRLVREDDHAAYANILTSIDWKLSGVSHDLL